MKLWSRNFILVSLGNFLMYNAFYMLLPILPLYLANELHASESMIGTILSLYTIAALVTRPIAGFWLDKVARHPKVYLSPTKFNVHFRYLKTKPLLLPGLKNAAIGGIIKYS